MTLQTLNNIRELAQQLRVGSVRRRRCPGRPVSGRAAVTSAPARHPAHGADPTTMPAAVGIPWQERASADRCHGRADHQPISAAGNELKGSTTPGHLARNITLAARNDGGSESPGAPGV